ncbi:MAG: PilZ domain-containing protein [Candidatus Omnitrophica bacterium]|nr:PilZ domain-containing protein [Candidatus Omnitrophota bacterium]
MKEVKKEKSAKDMPKENIQETNIEFSGPERRQFVRLDYAAPLAYKVCKKETISNILQGYTVNVSQSGALCKIKDKVRKNDILWVSFDRNALNICKDMEKNAVIYQNGIIGKVVRIEHNRDKDYEIGIRFITKEEKNFNNIYPKVHFLI